MCISTNTDNSTLSPILYSYSSLNFCSLRKASLAPVAVAFERTFILNATIATPAMTLVMFDTKRTISGTYAAIAKLCEHQTGWSSGMTPVLNNSIEFS